MVELKVEDTSCIQMHIILEPWVFLFLPGAETVETVSGDCLNTACLKDTSVHSLHPKGTYEFT